MKSILLLLLLIVLGRPAPREAPPPPPPVPATSVAAPPDAPPAPADLSAMLGELVKKHKVPALAAAVSDGQRIIARGVSGVRAKGFPDDERNRATLEDRWHIGSCTKSMTATLCARLVERGVLTWDRTLGEAFPDEAPAMHADFRAVTLRQLVTQRSGIAGAPPGNLWSRLWAGNQGPTTAGRRLALAAITARAPASPPGTKFEYSNFNFMLAGLMAEQATGRTWEDLMRAEVFAPLRLESAGFGAPGSPQVLDNARGHNPNGLALAPGPQADNPASLGPAGTVHMTVEDLARYAAAHMRGQAGADDGYLRVESWRTLHTPPGDGGDYAMGWVLKQRRRPAEAAPAAGYWHNGSNTMWYVEMEFVPAWGRAVVVAANAADEGAEQAVREALERLVREP